MKLKYNRKTELEVVGFGVFKPGQHVTIESDDQAARYLNSGYFDLVKEKEKVKKEEKVKITEEIIKIKVKKAKKERS